MRIGRSLALGLVFFGCNGSVPPPAPPGVIPPDRSGDRIKIRSWSSPDGVLGDAAPWDSATNAPCAWRHHADGRYRCLPVNTTFAYPVRFADPQCTRPTFTQFARECDELPGYVTTPAPQATCPSSIALHEIGPKVPTPGYYALSASGSCVARPPAAGSTPQTPQTQDRYEIGQEVALTSFAAASLRVGEAVGSQAAVYLEGDDGLRMFWNLRDLAGGFDCLVDTAADGVLRCAPDATARAGGTYSDASCMEEAAEADRSSCTPGESFAARIHLSSCKRRVSFYPVRERAAAGYFSYVDGCQTSILAPYFDYFVLGAELPPSGFAPVTIQPIDDLRRLRNSKVAIGGHSYGSNTFWDSTLQQNCSAILMSDGTNRCAAFPVAPVDLLAGPFSDPDCTKVLVAGDFEGCAPATGFIAGRGCPVPYRLFRILPDAHTGPVYQYGGKGCTATPPLSDQVPYPVAGEIAPTDLVALTQITK
jgi:hypothetical protein